MLTKQRGWDDVMAAANLLLRTDHEQGDGARHSLRKSESACRDRVHRKRVERYISLRVQQWAK